MSAMAAAGMEKIKHPSLCRPSDAKRRYHRGQQKENKQHERLRGCCFEDQVRTGYSASCLQKGIDHLYIALSAVAKN